MLREYFILISLLKFKWMFPNSYWYYLFISHIHIPYFYIHYCDFIPTREC